MLPLGFGVSVSTDIASVFSTFHKFQKGETPQLNKRGGSVAAARLASSRLSKPTLATEACG